MQELGATSITDMLLMGSVLLFGVTAFLLVRHLFPEQLLAEVAERAEETERQRERAREKGYIPPPPPGKDHLWPAPPPSVRPADPSRSRPQSIPSPDGPACRGRRSRRGAGVADRAGFENQ